MLLTSSSSMFFFSSKIPLPHLKSLCLTSTFFYGCTDFIAINSLELNFVFYLDYFFYVYHYVMNKNIDS